MNSICRRNIDIQSVRRIKATDEAQVACVTFEHLTGKELFTQNFPPNFNGLVIKESKQGPHKTDIERVHTNYCKFALGLSKYASS